MSQNFSYAQIERLGKYLQKGAKEKRLGFLKTANFDQRFISKLSQDCFGKVINDNLIDKLSTVPFSLILDNSTFCGESICALKVKFLSKDWEEDSEAEITSIKNKIIGISNLKESSSGLTLLEIIESKLLKNENVQKNLVGFAHDNGSSLTGEYFGVTKLLKNKGLKFFDLRDPCHGLDLSLKHSIKELPSNLVKFTQTISNHFASSQKKSNITPNSRGKSFKNFIP